MNPFEYVTPQTVPQAMTSVLEVKDSYAKAGGIDLLDLMKEGIVSPPRLVNLLGLHEAALRRIEHQRGKGLRIGALVTLAEIAADQTIQESFTALSDAAADAATPQVRNRATVGGNLCQRPRCWYFRGEDFPCLRKYGEICYAVAGLNRYHAIFGGGPCHIVHPSNIAPALIAFDARVHIVSPTGERDVPLEEFFVLPAKDPHHENILQPGELITEVFIPEPKANTRSAYQEYREKQSYDWPLVAAAVALTTNGKTVQAARIVMGAVAPIPWRVPASEKVLTGKALTRELATKAGQAAVANAEPMTENEFKVPLARSVVYRTILHAAGRLLPGNPDD